VSSESGYILCVSTASPREAFNPARYGYFIPPGTCATLCLLSLTHMHLQDGTANQRHPLYSSESPQHISIKKQE